MKYKIAFLYFVAGIVCCFLGSFLITTGAAMSSFWGLGLFTMGVITSVGLLLCWVLSGLTIATWDKGEG